MATSSPTLRRVKIYVLLSRRTGGHGWRCQKDVANVLKINRGRVSDNVRSLVEQGYLSEIPGSHSPKYYRQGPNSTVMEEYIKKFYTQDPEWFAFFAQDVTPPVPAGTSSDPFVLPLRAHLKGGAIQFVVEEEGERKVIWDRDTAGNRRPLHLDLDGPPHYTIKGGSNWQNTNLRWDGKTVELRYHVTAKGRWLYVTPSDQVVTIHQTEIGPLNDRLEPFLRQCYAILRHLEAKGGWRFARDGDAYAYSASVEIEWAVADEEVNAAIKDLAGGEFGIPGLSDVWYDNSVPGGEAESSREEFVQSLGDLPNIRRRQMALVGAVRRQEAELLEQKLALSQEVTEIYEHMRGQVRLFKDQIDSPPFDGRGYQ